MTTLDPPISSQHSLYLTIKGIQDISLIHKVYVSAGVHLFVCKMPQKVVNGLQLNFPEMLTTGQGMEDYISVVIQIPVWIQ